MKSNILHEKASRVSECRNPSRFYKDWTSDLQKSLDRGYSCFSASRAFPLHLEDLFSCLLAAVISALHILIELTTAIAERHPDRKMKDANEAVIGQWCLKLFKAICKKYLAG